MTGATGFLGTRLCLRMVQETDHSVVALVRASDHDAARRRLRRAWSDWPELAEHAGGRVQVLPGDVAEPHLGLGDEDYAGLVSSLSHIVHSAADMRLDGPIEELRRINVGGTRHVLELARAVHADHGLQRLSHVSTAYVAGSRRGVVPEDSLSDEWGFSSRYELSKFEGEQLVKEAKAELPISVFRPGLVVGDSETGAIKTFNTIYFPLKLFLTGRLRVLPARPSLKVNLIPVDYVADAIYRLTFDDRAEGLNFHLTAAWEDLPTARELLDYVRAWAREELGIQLGRPLFVPMGVGATKGRYRAQQVITRERTGIFEALRTLAPYFNERRRFSRDNVDRLLGGYRLDWRRVLPPIMRYAIHLGFLHRSDRTVHEQVLFRMRSRSIPVTYHDVHGGRVHTRDPAEVRREMLAVAGALRAMGIGPGDRVALVGLNSSRFMTIDVGIGLAGAVSVPLYYTCPPQEIDLLLEASGSKLLLVGTPKILQRLGELETRLPVVSFCREEREPRTDHGREVMPWRDFLALGEGGDAPAAAPVTFSDLATVRYTSGTTGKPKGVTFRHENLRWMGTTLASLLDWGTRTSHVSYLSFLPMNHVVEGILAAYAPYYAPAPVDIYFLEDFRDLQGTLPRIRPTIFFAVPRFYEKLWEALAATGPGQSYVGAPEGVKKRLLRRVLRRALLRRAGLDRCRQLIVGSAPIGPDLLASFQGLGVEVHNAYGLTEAPLVTMNRLGRNRIETVGEPLPETELRTIGEGEVLVRGPQVTPGYLDPATPSCLEEGWLHTGDLGHVTDEGSLVLHGRSKELIVTSYGKNIHPVKVEAMLRDLAGVDEVMVVGDGRPYCTALLWVGCDDGDDGEALVAPINEGLEAVNGRLSNPERIKRWAILRNDLGIECGDLTASLKLKRREVSQRFARVVEALYGNDQPPSEGLLHLGGGERR